jgi:hypothetical protein
MLFPIGGKLLEKPLGYEMSTDAGVILYFIGLVLIAYRLLRLELKDIKSSRQRMQNPEYREFLREIGLLKK